MNKIRRNVVAMFSESSSNALFINHLEMKKILLGIVSVLPYSSL
jgi:hypothetical protein